MKKLLLAFVFCFSLLSSFSQTANPVSDLSVCDDEISDGFTLFDLTIVEPEVLGSQDPIALTLTYHETLLDADTGANPIVSPQAYNNISNPQTIYVRLESATSGNYAVTNFNILVNPTPVFFIEDISICEGDSALVTTAIDSEEHIFEWSYNGVVIPEATSASYTVTQEGSYTVSATNVFGNCSYVNSFVVSLLPEENCEPLPEILMQNGTFTICEGIFTDTGGVNSNYGNDENLVMTFCPEVDGDKVSLNFTSYETQIGFNADVLTIYDGDSDLAPVLETLSGFYDTSEGNGLFLASDTNTSGCLTVSFVSGNTGNTIGWEAAISCFQTCQDITPSIDNTIPEANEDGVLIVGNGQDVTFNASAIFSEDGTNAIYTWDFGDGNEATGINVTHTFTTNGLYDVTLTVTDNNPLGCQESTSITVEVIDQKLSINDASYPQSFFFLEELIVNAFVTDGVTVNNFSSQVNGSPSSLETKNYGYFNRGDAQNFPFAEGVVLSTGVAFQGGNTTNNTLVSNNNMQPGDADLENALNIVNTNDAAFIKFDFVPAGNEISFRYILASEEYDGSSECNFTDSFAFLLREAGTTEYTNLAVLPDGTPVNVTNVNNAPNCTSNPEFFEGYNIGDTNYGGRTAVLTASASVTPNTTYEIKLVIADQGDNIWDSAIFLEAFNSGNTNTDVGYITVEAFNDFNDNGIKDNDENRFANGTFTYEKNNDGVITEVNTSTGSFTILSEDETDTYDISFSVNDDLASCFTQNTTSFDNVGVLFGEVTDVDFPVINDQNCEDLAVYVINNWAPPRPGFTHNNYLYLQNLGFTTITSGTVEFIIDSQLVYNNTFSVNPAYTITNTATGFTVDFVNLQPGDVESIGVSLTCPAEVSLDEIVTNTATYLTNANDLVSSNNSSVLSEVVIGSYDPNDKMEVHGPEIVYDAFINSNEWLYYTIRFQNVGTAEAIFVRIEDELDSQLDETTFQMLRSSHDYMVTRTGNALEWYFEDINLPAEQDDADGSNGFVYFRIKPKAGYALGDVISNNASIYFDFNAPIITNTFTTTFVETLSVDTFSNVGFSIYPNPANDMVTVALANFNEDYTLELIDIQGKIIYSKAIYAVTSEIDITALKSGLYFVKITSQKHSKVEKLIVE